MKLDNRVRPILESIDFISRYKRMSDENSDYDNKLKNYSNDEVEKVTKSLGYELSFNRKESFFKLMEQNGDLKTQLNISLKYGLVELILDVVKAGERYTLGGPFGLICQLLGEEEKIKYPAFTNYDQLRKILKEGFSIYEDFKKELLKLDG